MITGLIAAVVAIVGLAATRFIPKNLKFRLPDAAPPGPMASTGESSGAQIGKKRTIDMRMIMAVVVTIVALAIALIAVIGSDANRESQVWAYGAIGTILVFWLKP